MTTKHKPGCEALGGYGNGVGACACTAEQKPSEWTRKAMLLAYVFAHEKSYERADEAYQDLRAHLIRRDEAVCAVVEALERADDIAKALSVLSDYEENKQ
jgi:hypothetical protein